MDQPRNHADPRWRSSTDKSPVPLPLPPLCAPALGRAMSLIAAIVALRREVG
jgi:hypothetical protein